MKLKNKDLDSRLSKHAHFTVSLCNVLDLQTADWHK